MDVRTKIIFYFFQKGLDNQSEVWYNGYSNQEKTKTRLTQP